MTRAVKERPLLRALVALTSACVSTESAFQFSEAEYRDELERRYPAGTPWGEPNDQLGPFEHWDLSAPAPDGFAEHALAHVRRNGRPVAACVFGFVPRWGWGSSIGAFGIWCDYVFLDAERRIVVAFRRFFD